MTNLRYVRQSNLRYGYCNFLISIMSSESLILFIFKMGHLLLHYPYMMLSKKRIYLFKFNNRSKWVVIVENFDFIHFYELYSNYICKLKVMSKVLLSLDNDKKYKYFV